MRWYCFVGWVLGVLGAAVLEQKKVGTSGMAGYTCMLGVLIVVAVKNGGNHTYVCMLTPFHLAYRAPGDGCCLTSEGHRVQLGIDHETIAQIVGGCPLLVLDVIEEPGRIPEPLAMFSHKLIVDRI